MLRPSHPNGNTLDASRNARQVCVAAYTTNLESTLKTSARLRRAGGQRSESWPSWLLSLGCSGGRVRWRLSPDDELANERPTLLVHLPENRPVV